MLRVGPQPFCINLLIRKRFLHKAPEGVVAHPAYKRASAAQTRNPYRDIGRCAARTLQQFTLSVGQQIHHGIAKYPDRLHITFLAKSC